MRQTRRHSQLSRGASEEWQRRWDLTEDDRWTHRVLPYIKEWISRRHGFATFHLTQVLTGHGCFRSYLHRIGVYHSAQCPVCPGIDEDVEHALLAYPRFENQREQFRASWEGPLTPEGNGRCMLALQERCDAVVSLATSIVERLNSIQRAEEKRGVDNTDG